MTFASGDVRAAARTLGSPAERAVVTLQVLSRVERVTSCLHGPGPVELYAERRAGAREPELVVEAYAAGAVLAAGTLAVWDLNQALAALLSPAAQARRLALREDGRGHEGYLDLVTGAAGAEASVFVLARGSGRRAEYRAPAVDLAADLNAVLHHYLDMTRRTPRTIVLPDARTAPVR